MAFPCAARAVTVSTVSYRQQPEKACIVPTPAARSSRALLASKATKSNKSQETQVATPATQPQRRNSAQGRMGGLGDVLGPIGLTLGGQLNQKKVDTANASSDSGEPTASRHSSNGASTSSSASSSPNVVESAAKAAGLSMGPISLTFGDDFASSTSRQNGSEEQAQSHGEDTAQRSISSLTTQQWREKYEKDGCVDLWVQEEFNAGSRLVGGRDVHKGGLAGFRAGEGPSAGNVAVHTVKIYNKFIDQEIDVSVPEDRYVLWEAEDQGLTLPYACRMGCCTACAVRVLQGEMYQPQALGVSAELRERGFALMCVGYPRSNLVLETVEEDELYDLQFGQYFAQQAVDPNTGFVERDDFALEIANMDE